MSTGSGGNKSLFYLILNAKHKAMMRCISFQVNLMFSATITHQNPTLPCETEALIETPDSIK